ncbi:hypothetical protein [Mycolicibacterium peregrinum]|uniref:phosphatase domain-containing protein n=1 Tax=Mycolicibacterium peregrinum TaxID=43304 RepID=UPI0009EDB0F5
MRATTQSWLASTPSGTPAASYVHCWGGKGRTSTVIGCLLAESGLSYDDVIARIAELRAGTRKAAYPCPESTTQHDLLRARCVR